MELKQITFQSYFSMLKRIVFFALCVCQNILLEPTLNQ